MWTMANLSIRALDDADESVLWQMIFYAAHLHNEPGKTVQDAIQNPTLANYVNGWGRPGDLGFIAESAATQTAVGAVWVRLYTGENKGYSPTADDTPELAMAVLPAYVGQGIGTRLLQHLIDAARPHYPAIALNVRADNPAFRLYQRLGFVIVSELINRVGGISYDMRLNF